jgi:hypothetical protein
MRYMTAAPAFKRGIHVDIDTEIIPMRWIRLEMGNLNAQPTGLIRELIAQRCAWAFCPG